MEHPSVRRYLPDAIHRFTPIYHTWEDLMRRSDTAPNLLAATVGVRFTSPWAVTNRASSLTQDNGVVFTPFHPGSNNRQNP